MSAHEFKWPSAVARAEAASWVARLHGPNRTKDIEAGLRRWLADDPQHPPALQMIVGIWERSGRLRRRPIVSRSLAAPRMRSSRTFFAIIVTAIVAVIVTLILA